MTLAALDLPSIDLGISVSDAYWFEPFEASTENAAQTDIAPMLERLVELSSAADSLDWDTLARINIEGWGEDGDTR